ncbi:MAG TPA: thioredoxin family protein [Alphaproteobacteria bacterium]
MAEIPPICDFGWKAPDFRLKGTDGAWHTLQELRGPKGTLVVFMCNHCPYVKAILPRLIRDAKELAALGVTTVAISANDPGSYPDDSFDNMARIAREKQFPFPYLYDESQGVARAYDAVCTPDFFGFNAALELQYRGRLDESKTNPVPNARRELYDAMRQVAETGRGPRQQNASMGCSIKWRQAA